MRGFAEEVYFAAGRVAESIARLGAPWSDVKHSGLDVQFGDRRRRPDIATA
jgi:hypothetical protein